MARGKIASKARLLGARTRRTDGSAPALLLTEQMCHIDALDEAIVRLSTECPTARSGSCASWFGIGQRWCASGVPRPAGCRRRSKAPTLSSRRGFGSAFKHEYTWSCIRRGISPQSTHLPFVADPHVESGRATGAPAVPLRRGGGDSLLQLVAYLVTAFGSPVRNHRVVFAHLAAAHDYIRQCIVH
jgi:hypothetical protein